MCCLPAVTKPRRTILSLIFRGNLSISLPSPVSDSSLFRGTSEQLPTFPGTFSVAQKGQLTYALDCDVINPANPTQTRNVGKLYGTIPEDENNVYRFSDGTVRVSVFGIGAAKGFESKFSVLALGKPPQKSEGILDKVKKEALSFTKEVNGKSVATSVSKYDKMEFQPVLASGPVQIYPEVTVNGALIYDCGRAAWYFQNVTVSYAVDGQRMQDSLTGNIRGIESAICKSTESISSTSGSTNRPQVKLRSSLHRGLDRLFDGNDEVQGHDEWRHSCRVVGDQRTHRQQTYEAANDVFVQVAVPVCDRSAER